MPIQKHSPETALTENTPDSALVSLAANGSSAAFESIMRRYNRRLFRTARSILKNDTEAEDALQEAYIHAWRALDSFRFDAQLSTWLVRIVVNESLGRLRRDKRAQIIPLTTDISELELDDEDSLMGDPNQQPENTAMRTELRTAVEARIDLLPETFRTVFVMRAVEEMSVEEVSQILDIPEATVRTRYFRARSLLRESLAQDIDTALENVFSFDGKRCDRIVANVLAKVKTTI
jgi:RNA polymerase sigma-70 factor (ECF subfamily)